MRLKKFQLAMIHRIPQSGFSAIFLFGLTLFFMFGHSQASETQSLDILKQGQRDLQECRERVSSCFVELELARRDAEDLQDCQTNLNACQERLSSTFLAVVFQ